MKAARFALQYTVKRCAHTSSACEAITQPTLVREWVADALYSTSHGYFSKKASPVGQIPQPIPFNALSGQQAYLQQLRVLYDTLQVSWLTPAEIFQPHYGHAVAQCILKEHKHEQPLNIIEIGAGSGRLARDILANHPDVYSSTSYTTLEISPHLAAMQQQKVLHGNKHASQFSVVQQDAAQSLAWHVPDLQPCVIIMMEVLDNMPHDRVWRQTPQSPWQETWIEPVGVQQQPQQQMWREMLRPASDPLLLTCLRAAEEQRQQEPPQGPLPWLQAAVEWALGPSDLGSTGRGGEALWLPTSCLQLLQYMSRSRPNHLLIAADFDKLPEVVIPGENAPLVASTVNGQTIDHASLLAPKGTADIFFPTNFNLLKQLHVTAQQEQGHQVQGSVCKTQAFMRKFADIHATSTADGYNPLLEDFSNTSFYIGKAGAWLGMMKSPGQP